MNTLQLVMTVSTAKSRTTHGPLPRLRDSMPRFSRLLAFTASSWWSPSPTRNLTLSPVFSKAPATIRSTDCHVVGTAGAGGSASMSATNLPIFFEYFGIADLPAELSGLQSAHLTFTSFTTLGPTTSGTGFDNIFDGSGVNSAMITMTRDTPASEGLGSKTILLEALFTPFTFSGSGGSDSFSASSLAGMVTFNSDFLTFSNSVERDLGLMFSSIDPSLGIGPNGFLDDFAAAGAGTFSSNPVPTFVPTSVPEPSTCMLMGAGLAAAAFGLVVRRRRLEQVPASQVRLLSKELRGAR